jgi:hypothetical protein
MPQAWPLSGRWSKAVPTYGPDSQCFVVFVARRCRKPTPQARSDRAACIRSREFPNGHKRAERRSEKTHLPPCESVGGKREFQAVTAAPGPRPSTARSLRFDTRAPPCVARHHVTHCGPGVRKPRRKLSDALRPRNTSVFRRSAPSLTETATRAPQPECIRTPMAARFNFQACREKLCHRWLKRDASAVVGDSSRQRVSKGEQTILTRPEDASEPVFFFMSRRTRAM